MDSDLDSLIIIIIFIFIGYDLYNYYNTNKTINGYLQSRYNSTTLFLNNLINSTPIPTPIQKITPTPIQIITPTPIQKITPNTIPKTTPNTIPKTTPNTIPKTTPNTIPKTTPNTIPSLANLYSMDDCILYKKLITLKNSNSLPQGLNVTSATSTNVTTAKFGLGILRNTLYATGLPPNTPKGLNNLTAACIS